MFTAQDVMTVNMVTVTPDATVEEASDLMLRHHVSGLPVVDGQGRLAGLVTEFDLLKLVYDPRTSNNRVADYMTTDVVSIRPDASMIEVADLFILQRVRRLPVVEVQRMVGLISRRDLIRFVYSLRERIKDARQVPPMAMRDAHTRCGSSSASV